MKFRDLVAACLTGVLLLPAGCADEKLKMEVPDTDTAVFTQMEQTNLEEWNNAQTEKVLEVPLVRRDVERAAGGTIPLYALDTGEEPATGTDQLTSVSAALVLNSSAVWLGEYGAVRDLAESELYHWADASEFDHIQYTQPMQLSEKRCVVHLLLENDTVGMEQLVCYTDLGNGTARVDRLWHTLADGQTDEDSDVFDQTAAALIASETE
ncbi:MAG: hypothetical protein ACLTWR_07070 [Agathobaculum desmolans]|uniref:hypothetical protein n=1 Tax=Agathobaculum desmolans TaxID=39484 RepID=UPI0039937A12